MKVESYEVLVPGIPEDFIPEHKEIRYRIIDEENGSVLDDAQGYGYKSAQNAYRAFGYKTKTKNNVNKEKRRNIPRSNQKALKLLKEKKEDDLLFSYKCLRGELQREPTEKELKEQEKRYSREFYGPYKILLKNCQNETEIISILEKIDKECGEDLVSRYKENQ